MEVVDTYALFICCFPVAVVFATHTRSDWVADQLRNVQNCSSHYQSYYQIPLDWANSTLRIISSLRLTVNSPDKVEFKLPRTHSLLAERMVLEDNSPDEHLEYIKYYMITRLNTSKVV